MRLDRLFSELGLLSRSECRKACRAGLISVNGESVRRPDIHIEPDADDIFYNGKKIVTGLFVYYMLNKPAGLVTAREDRLHRTVFSCIDDSRPSLSAAGRLDKDTTGILLITNDGMLNHRLLSSKYHVPKTYIVRTDIPLCEDDMELLSNGIDIGDKNPTLPAKAVLLSEREASLTLTEGRYHQVKRMFAAIGKPVISLHRSSFGPLLLDTGLSPGQYRSLTSGEIMALKESVGL